MISTEEARKIILSETTEIHVETVPLADAHNRILASDIISNDDIPPFENSSMDGFALRSSDTMGSSSKNAVELRIIGEVAAGAVSGESLRPMQAIRILTGAPLPPGADAVVPHEQVKEREGVIRVAEPVAYGSSTREKGEDITKGEKVLARGTNIEAAHLGLLASMGCAKVAVLRKPTMAILTTGNELLSVSDDLKDGMIRNSNAYSLRALAEENRCEPVDLGVARDDETELLQKIREGLKYDLFVTSGGISAGKYDYVLDSMKKAGVVLKFWKVNIKPGMPFAFGVWSNDERKVLVFCLPGNPVSTVVTFLEFVRPCIEKMMLKNDDTPIVRLQAKLEHALSKSDGKRHFHRGIVRSERGKLYVRSTGNQSSGVLSSLVKANCLIILNEQQSVFEEGSDVDIDLLPWANIK
jgi:molybdopterin molybdotransferase